MVKCLEQCWLPVSLCSVLASIPIGTALPFVLIPQGSSEGSRLPGLIPMFPRHNQHRLTEHSHLLEATGMVGKQIDMMPEPFIPSFRSGGRYHIISMGVEGKHSLHKIVRQQELTQWKDQGWLPWVY